MLNISDERLAHIMADFDRTWSTGSSCSSSSADRDCQVGDAYCAQDAIRPLVAINCSQFVVAHAKGELQPARRFSEVFLLKHILETMRKLGLNLLLRLQSYTWPHLTGGAGHGAMIVSAPRSGRTFAYVPAVCHVVCKALTESRNRRKDLPPLSWPQDQYGPMALILVPDLRRVQQVSAMCRALLRKAEREEWLTLTLNVPSSKNSEFFLRLLNGVGCLVATPAQLAWFWEEAPGLMRFPCLQFLVYDDVDLMAEEQLTKAQQVLQEILPLTHSPQVVMVSQSYSPKLMARLRSVNDDPALVFGDILEAALYGGTRIRISLLRSTAKINAVVQMLQQCPPEDYRTVIFCIDDRDMQHLVAALEERGYDCLPYYQNADLEVFEKVHSWQANSRGVILLCTDDCPELIIRDAHTLIHHSLSQSWRKFKMRHLMLTDNLRNSLASTVSPAKLPLHSLVLLDDNNHRQLPRLVDFLQLHQEVDPGVVALAKRIRKEMGQAKSEQRALCDQILMMGKCYDPVCEDRHQVAPFDRRPAHMPASGDVKVQLVDVYSPTHFCVRLLEHLPAGGTWQVLPFTGVQEMRMKLMQPKKPRRYWPPEVGVICMYHSTFTKERVRVLKVAPIKNVNFAQSDVAVVLQALDTDTRIFSTTSGQLSQCPEALQRQPPLSCDLRLVGLVPYCGERSWTEDDCSKVKYMLTQLPKGHFLQAKIQFTAAGTLFARDLVAMVYADQFKVHLRHLNLKKNLIKRTLAKKCEQAIDMIQEFFEEVLVEDVSEGKVKVAKEKAENEPKEKAKDAVLVESQPVLSARCQRLVELALRMGRENEKRRELEEMQSKSTEVQKNQLAKPVTPATEASKPLSNEDSVAQLYECMMNCTLLQLEDEKEPAEDPYQTMNTDPADFLTQVINNEPTVKRKAKRSKAKGAPAAAPPPDHFRREVPLQLPPNVVRPSVNYYQTVTTLELQVSLPEDDHEYTALLAGAQIFFRATSKSSELIQQFILTLRFPYAALRHLIRGRTVYISVTKSLAFIDPLAFGEHRFMKPNHDKFDKMEDHRRMAHNRFASVVDEYRPKPNIVLQEKSEESGDEERNMDGIEHVDTHNIMCD
ncbi:putative ATP-dependent RNA helicase BoYb [Drosophila biarmipes]|uniref:putative ATP-dependent RNA helicase BoYb n=1 Tax=Drosophila biarmipes TaxID=125945 RepID=UPI0007E8560B|nr:putative ATP-dependent RNA helicase BoYb [Drosophila biarmipes]